MWTGSLDIPVGSVMANNKEDNVGKGIDEDTYSR